MTQPPAGATGMTEREIDDNQATNAPTKKGLGDFFTIDRRTWSALCDCEDVKLAVTYLAIAQGTLKGGRISSWSAKSIETHLGLHSTRAKKVIGELIDLGFLQRDASAHSRASRPRYVVPSFPEVHKATFTKRLAALGSHAGWVIERIIESGESGWTPWPDSRSPANRKALGRLSDKGFVRQERGKWFMAEPNPKPELIWLPNALVQGTTRGEDSPLRELRRVNDIWALRLFIDLYQAQNLSADGGISRTVFRGNFTARVLSPRGRHVILGFTRGSGDSASWADPVDGVTSVHWDRPEDETEESAIWQSMGVLIEKGLVVMVPHLVENKDPECEIIHAYGTDQNAEPMERELGEAAQEAAEYLLGEEWTGNHVGSVDHMAPTYASNRDMQMVGIYRLRYRPRTSLTADWYRRLEQDYREWGAHYAKLCGRSFEVSRSFEKRAG
jgi:hypothetical protein